MVPLSPDTLGHQSLNSLNLKILSIISQCQESLAASARFPLLNNKIINYIIKILVLSLWKRKGCQTIPSFPSSCPHFPQGAATGETVYSCYRESSAAVQFTHWEETDAKAWCLHEAGGLKPGGSFPALNWSLVHQGCLECMWGREGSFVITDSDLASPGL